MKTTFSHLKESCPNLKLENTKLIHGKRQPPNLKKILTNASFSNKKSTASISQCGDLKCLCCDYLYDKTEYTFKHTGYTFHLKSKMSCDSSNLIYCIICQGCGEEYIGETGKGKTKLRDRVRVYRQRIHDLNYRTIHVEKHLWTCAKGNFKIFPFLQMKKDCTSLRREYEKTFQKKFKTTLNK